MLERLPITYTNRPLEVLRHWMKDGYLHLSPPYQRGDVWGTARQRNLVSSLLLGVPIPSVVVNDRMAANWGDDIVVIDGKQRIGAILAFFESRLSVPAEWFGVDGSQVVYGDLVLPQRRRFNNLTLGVCEAALGSIEQERQVFDLINFGGLAQGESDL